jgi:hypothetical protein
LDDIGWLGVSNRICKQFAAAFGIVSFQWLTYQSTHSQRTTTSCISEKCNPVVWWVLLQLLCEEGCHGGVTCLVCLGGTFLCQSPGTKIM